MAASKDVLNFGIPPKEIDKEYITPHKIAVALFIRDFCICKSHDKIQLENGTVYTMEPSNRKAFGLLTLNLIQSPDMDYWEFVEAFSRSEYTSLLTGHKNAFKDNMQQLCEKGVGTLVDLMQNLTTYFMEQSHVPPIIGKSSVIGLYLRRLMILFDKLSFAELVSVYKSFKLYYTKSESHAPKDVSSKLDSSLFIEIPELTISYDNITVEDNTFEGLSMNQGSERTCWTRRQAELFIAQQATLLQTNDAAALSPPVMQTRIRQLLQKNPKYAEAHYLSYLNCLRVKEYCGAVESLFHCFDRSTFAGDTKAANQDERSKNFRYSGLNLAMLHDQFGHSKAAMHALREAIMLGHEANDFVCLQHCQAWLSKLCDSNKELQMERSISKSSDLNLSYLTSLGIQSVCKHSALAGGKPSLVFDLLQKSDILNCQRSMVELVVSNSALKSALWAMYGNSAMASLTSQQLLHLHTGTRGNLPYSGEGTCQAVCNVANTLTEQGEYQLAAVVLQHAALRFPNEPVSRNWKLCQQILDFTKAFHYEKWGEAEQAAANIAAFDQCENRLRRAELCLSMGRLLDALPLLRDVLDSEEAMPAVHVRALTIHGELHCSNTTAANAPSEAVAMFTSALDLARSHHLIYCTAMIRLHLANVQFQMHMSSHALRLVDQALPIVLSYGGHYDQARALLIFAKCKVASVADEPEEKKNAVILEAVQLLDVAKDSFQKMQAFSRVKDVLYLQAILCHQIGHFDARDQWSMEFRYLNEEFPATLVTTLLTRL